MIDKKIIIKKCESVMGKLTTKYNTNLSSMSSQNIHSIKDELYNDDSTISNFNYLLPMVKRVSAATLAGGGMRKSKKQQLKENRINKLKELKGEEPNIILPDDEKIEGLISVMPMSSPCSSFLYVDFTYNYIDPITKIKKDRISKLDKINISFRLDKLKYIEKITKKYG